jgi:hypothetical protein
MTTSTNISRPGQANETGDILALYKDSMVPQLIKFYTDNLVAANFFSRQKISNAKAAEFTLIGKTSAQYVAAGTERNGTNKVPHNKILVPVDNFLSTDIFVAEDDEAMWHRDDLRQQYLEQMGIALALQEEHYTFQVAVNAARSASPITGGTAGSVIKNTSMASDGAVLGAAFFSAAQAASEKNIRISDLRAFLKPLQYYTLAQKLDYINSLYGGAGAIKDGTIFKVAGIDIKQTNCLPSSVKTKDALQRGTDYDGDFTKTVGLIAAPQAIGTVELIGMKVVTEAQPLKHGTMLAASNLIGKGVVNPCLAFELSKAA